MIGCILRLDRRNIIAGKLTLRTMAARGAGFIALYSVSSYGEDLWDMTEDEEMNGLSRSVAGQNRECEGQILRT